MGRLGTSVSGPDGLFLPQTSQSEIGHETDAPEPRQDCHLVQIEVLWAPQIILTMTAKQLLEMTQLWYKTHEQWKWASEQLTKLRKEKEELEGWRTALQLDNLQLRRQLGYDEVDYKGPPAQTMTRRDGGTQTDDGVGCDPGISQQPEQSF